ncbi:MAG: family 10 glycosylhydrolase, partial [Cyanobacteria bacterium NC_groundwater_1444_Ag_S-0.65um_54_12]|nr:family 10 glycosylhydrolase [Cyanobacteria bacterium NC_groundwater_1444_Ag_S-0.65um_54_12]
MLFPSAIAAARAVGDSTERLMALRAKITALRRDLQQARAAMLDLPLELVERDLFSGTRYLERAEQLAANREYPEIAEFWFDLTAFSLRSASRYLVPSRSVEARGMLIDADAIPKNFAGVRKLVDLLANANFNILLPEAIRRGYTVYPSNWLERDPEFAGAPDVFGELVNYAQRRGLEVHPWIWTLRVRSYDAQRDYGNPVIARFPALAARSDTTERPRFLSPANPGTKQFLLREISELLERYAVDGLFLDYIRYDEETTDDWSSQTAYRLEQLNSWQLPVALDIAKTSEQPASSASLEVERRNYQSWREEQVSRLVREVATLLRKRSGKLTLSAATFRGEHYTRRTKLQNWRYWIDQGYLGFAGSMLYSTDAKEVANWINQETDQGKRNTLLYPILGIHRMDQPAEDLLEQVQVIRQQSQPGILLFAMGHLPPSLLVDLR